MRLLRTLLRSLSLFCLLLLCGTSARAQHTFQTFLPGLFPAAKRPAVQTADGGFCILTQQLTGDDRISRFVLIKTNPDGLIEWARKYSRREDSDDYPTALRATPDGGFLAVGTTTVPGSGEQEIMVLRLNRQGYPLWNRTYRHSELDWAADAVVLDDGSAVIVGSTAVTDSTLVADYEWNEETEEYEETGDSIYQFSFREFPLALRITPEGEVVWGNWVKELPHGGYNEEDLKFNVSYAQAVCRREGNAVTLLAQITQRYYSIYSSLAVTLNDKGEAASGVWMPDKSEEPIFSRFANDLVPTSDGGCLLAGTARFYQNYGYMENTLFDRGELIALDRNDDLLWSKSYTGVGYTPLPSSIAPLDNNHYLVTGHTTLYSFDQDGPHNPILGVADASGTIEEARLWKTSLKDVPVEQSGGSRIEPYLWWPFFIPTADQGVLSVGTVRSYDTDTDPEMEPTPGEDAGMFVTRFNPDFTLCGADEVEPIDVAPQPLDQEISYDYSPDRDPIDLASQDYRKRAGREVPPPPLLVAAPDPLIAPDAVPSGPDDYNVSFDDPGITDQLQLSDPGPKSSKPPTYLGTMGEGNEEEDLPPVEDQSVIGITVYQHEEEVNNDYGGDEAGGYEEDEYYDESGYEENKQGEITRIDVALEKLEITSSSLVGLTVENIAVAPSVLCGDHLTPGTSSSAAEEMPIAEEYLRVVPNSVTKGKSVRVEFRLAGNDRPEVSLISVGQGDRIRRISPSAILWSEGEGRGSATIETADLAAGVYLVQVRVGTGGKQLSAKLEVR